VAVGLPLHAASLNVLYNFTTSNQGGSNPQAALVQGSDGNFYGTSSGNGSGNNGTVYKVTPAGVLTTLVSFTGANGANPCAGLVQGSDGNFYGTTEMGGSANEGTVFAMTPAGALTTLVSFTGANGANPYSGLVRGSDGNFYSTTESGGSAGDGTVFKITPAGALTTLVSFTGANGANPCAGLVQGSDGNFYGTTYAGGSNNEGTIFWMTPAGILAPLVSFSGANGANPFAGLVQSGAGNFYGTTSGGGNSGHGVIFQWVVPPDYYNGVLPVLTSQVGSSGVPGSQGLVQVKVTDSSGHPLVNAPITLSVTTGASTISTSSTIPGSLTPVNVLTDSNGMASVYVTFGTFATDVLTAIAQSGPQTTSISISLMPPFSNTSVSGMLLWLKADSIGGASPVSTWADQSGNGNDATQPSTSNQPTLVTGAVNGHPAVAFNGTSGYFNLPNFLANATQGEVFVVFESGIDPSNPHPLFAWGGAPYNTDLPYIDGHIYDTFGSTSQWGLGVPPVNLNTSFHLYNSNSGSTGWAGRLDGNVLFSTSPNSVAFPGGSQLQLGQGINNWDYLGDIAEIIVYNQVLTDAERAAVGQYLTAKYAFPDIPVPAAPTNLVANAVSPTQVSLAWTNPANTSAGITYTVERQSGSSGFQLVAEVNGALGYLDTGLTAGTTYTYEVQARTYAGSSGYCNTASATTLPATSIGLPTSGMQLWLSADTINSGPGPVSFWADQSGQNPANNATQTSASNLPTLVANAVNGRPVVAFNGTSSYLNLANFLANATQGEVFVVFETGSDPNPANQHPFWTWGQVNTWLPGSDGTIADAFGSTVQWNSGVPPVDLYTSFHIYDASAQASQWVNRLDGTELFEASPNTVQFSSASQLQIGEGVNYTHGYYLGDIAEIIVYNQVLDDADHFAVEQYLNSKYRIIQSPPSAPIDLATSMISATQETLVWGEVGQATSYSVERNSGNGFVQIAQVDSTAGYTNANSTSYVDSSPPAVSVIQYRVRAINAAGFSPYSNVVYATTTPDAIDPTDGLSYETDILLGLDPLADNSGFLPEFPPGDSPPPPVDQNSSNPPVVTLLTPSGWTLSP
jgi:uncharacterized repeat protein (TIGR03803 family)